MIHTPQTNLDNFWIWSLIWRVHTLVCIELYPCFGNMLCRYVCIHRQDTITSLRLTHPPNPLWVLHVYKSSWSVLTNSHTPPPPSLTHHLVKYSLTQHTSNMWPCCNVAWTLGRVAYMGASGKHVLYERCEEWNLNVHMVQFCIEWGWYFRITTCGQMSTPICVEDTIKILWTYPWD